MYHSSLNCGDTLIYFACLIALLEDDETPESLRAEYCSLVYHIPAGTALSKETNFPTNRSISANDTHSLVTKS